MHQKTLDFYPKDTQRLHIEMPGCVVNITVNLTDSEGRKVTSITISPDNDRFSGDTPWYLADVIPHNIRVIEGEKQYA